MSIRRMLARVLSLPGINPVAASVAAVINGLTTDRVGAIPTQPTEITAYTAYVTPSGIYNSANVLLAVGTATGAPTTQSTTIKVQHSDDASFSTDINDAPATAYLDPIPTLTANNTNANFDIDLAGLKRYIRVVVTVAFTGGTTPAQFVASSIVLGDAITDPAN